MRRLFFPAILYILSAAPPLPAQSASPAAEFPGVITKDVAVPMRDGVILRGDLLLPRGEGKFPVLVYRTPYGKHRAIADFTTFAKAVVRGYAVLIQDVRGRYASGGEFRAYQNEGRDGYDTIEWASAQSWSNGSVGTFGLSYPGAVQWLAAMEAPPHLKAMVPAMTFSTPRNFFYSGGVFDCSWLDWIWLNIAPDLRVKKNLPGDKTLEEAAASWKHEAARLQGFLPLLDLPDFKAAAPFYYDWLAHPSADPWWDWAELRGKYSRVTPAVLNLSGWFDETYGPDGATFNFNGLLAARRGEKNPRTRTILGAWTHGRQEFSKAGDTDFGATAAIDYDELILRWMDRYVRNVDNGVEKEKPVRIFVMGENVWRDEEAWPLARAREQSFYLFAADAQSRSGALRPTAPLAPSSDAPSPAIVSDPAHPLSDPYAEFGSHDYRSLAGRDDVLVFDSEPLAADTEVTGPIRAEIFLSADARDLDLWVRLLDVHPDGSAMNLMSPGLDVQRASRRNGALQPELLTPGETYRLVLDRLITSNLFRKGHRIRVQISGAFYPHFSRNLQSGESEMTSARMQTARIRILHDALHASRIVLPVIPR